LVGLHDIAEAILPDNLHITGEHRWHDRHTGENAVFAEKEVTVGNGFVHVVDDPDRRQFFAKAPQFRSFGHPLEIEGFEVLAKTDVGAVITLSESRTGSFREEYPCGGMEEVVVMIGRRSEQDLLGQFKAVPEIIFDMFCSGRIA